MPIRLWHGKSQSIAQSRVQRVSSSQKERIPHPKNGARVKEKRQRTKKKGKSNLQDRQGGVQCIDCLRNEQRYWKETGALQKAPVRLARSRSTVVGKKSLIKLKTWERREREKTLGWNNDVVIKDKKRERPGKKGIASGRGGRE